MMDSMAGAHPRPDVVADRLRDLRLANVSKIFRFQGDGFSWREVPIADYKPADASWKGVTRRVLVGETGESPDFHLRYFEIEPGGYTTLERHRHEHVVFVLRGKGEVLVGCETRALTFGDVVYVAPDDPHQFRNDEAAEPFGFLCIVNAERDRPREAGMSYCPICE